jgi:hypothetical protein
MGARTEEQRQRDEQRIGDDARRQRVQRQHGAALAAQQQQHGQRHKAEGIEHCQRRHTDERGQQTAKRGERQQRAHNYHHQRRMHIWSRHAACAPSRGERCRMSMEAMGLHGAVALLGRC